MTEKSFFIAIKFEGYTIFISQHLPSQLFQSLKTFKKGPIGCWAVRHIGGWAVPKPPVEVLIPQTTAREPTFFDVAVVLVCITTPIHQVSTPSPVWIVLRSTPPEPAGTDIFEGSTVVTVAARQAWKATLICSTSIRWVPACYRFQLTTSYFFSS